MKVTYYQDLSEKYEKTRTHQCDMVKGRVFISKDGKKPDGLCQSAWESMKPFVDKLANNIFDIYDGWMKNPKSAMISCNDGFRPVSFYLEVLED